MGWALLAAEAYRPDHADPQRNRFGALDCLRHHTFAAAAARPGSRSLRYPVDTRRARRGEALTHGSWYRYRFDGDLRDGAWELSHTLVDMSSLAHRDG